MKEPLGRVGEGWGGGEGRGLIFPSLLSTCFLHAHGYSWILEAFLETKTCSGVPSHDLSV